MNSRLLRAGIAFLFIAGTVSALAQSRLQVLTKLKQAADWQIANLKKPENGWVDATFFAGLVSLGKTPGCERYLEQMKAYGIALEWKLGPRKRHADDQCIAQAYLELFEITKDWQMAEQAAIRFEDMLGLPFNEPLTWRNSIANREWAWCDSLFMAPPALARCARVLNDPSYLELMDRLFIKTQRYLYNPTQKLFHRDGSFFDKREMNGQQVFWSRGNGWVLAGLARIMQYVPKAYRPRAIYENLFDQMSERIAGLQSKDGFWRASLLDPDSFPNPESSGTAFFCFALAWGVNEGLLDRDKYWPVVLKAWQALESALAPDGKLGWVQPVGADPRNATKDSTAPYGVGGLLLAGTEILRGLR